MRENTPKARWSRGEVTHGAWLSLPSPFAAGVPVNPTTRLKCALAPARALKRFACGFLNEESSSMTTMS